ncbi:MAG: Crp/Fnr family transcriptional regulator [Aquimonas sp.]|nr:Crp/Fnr family transcriptional regulator [Aquimonas sp.]
MSVVTLPDCATLLVRQLSTTLEWPAAAIDRLHEAHGRHRRLAAGEALVHAGSPMRGLFVAMQGSLKSVSTDADGNEQVMGFHLAGELIGLGALFHGRYRNSIFALVDSEVCEVALEPFEAAARSVPGVQHSLLRLAGRGVALDQDHMEILGHKQALERISLFLAQLSRRHQRLGLPHLRLHLDMSRQEIASYLGIVIETVSRGFGVLQDEGVIEVHGRDLRILQPERLGRPLIECGLPSFNRKRH